jgi:hypothetical protein
MKNIIERIMLAAFVFLIMAFIQYDLNPGNWNMGYRVITAAFIVAPVIVHYIATL